MDRSSNNINHSGSETYKKILGRRKKNIGATSFSWNVISSNRRFAEIQFCRIVMLPEQKIAESRLTESSYGWIIKLAKLHSAERMGVKIWNDEM